MEDTQRNKWLPKLCTHGVPGELLPDRAGLWSERTALRTRAVRDGDHYVLNGQKAVHFRRRPGDIYVVMVRTGEGGPGGISTLVVEATAGASLGANERKMGWNAQPTRAVISRTRACRSPTVWAKKASDFKGRDGTGLDGGRINIAGVFARRGAKRARRSLAYMKERKAFGKRPR